MSSPTQCAVVIAAGAGSRLRASSRDDRLVKPVTPVLGVPLVVRVLATLMEEGVEEAVVVTGYRSEELRRILPFDRRLRGLALRFVHNAEWAKKNGVSVLAARDAVGDRPFFLSMADHVYAGDVVRALAARPPAADELVLAVDRRTDEVTDPEDAMWVRLAEDGHIRAIGKDLTDYDAVDTGVFLSSPALFDALAAEAHERAGDCALADGVRRMAAGGRARTADIGDTWWQDVDTWANLQVAERKILAAREEEAGEDSRAASAGS